MVMPTVTEVPVEHSRVHVPVPKIAHAFPEGSNVAACGWVPPGNARPQTPSSVKCLDCLHLTGRREFYSRAA